MRWGIFSTLFCLRKLFQRLLFLACETAHTFFVDFLQYAVDFLLPVTLIDIIPVVDRIILMRFVKEILYQQCIGPPDDKYDEQNGRNRYQQYRNIIDKHHGRKLRDAYQHSNKRAGKMRFMTYIIFP